jgi:hypothetical protein
MSKENISNKKVINPVQNIILNYSCCYRGSYVYYVTVNNKIYTAKSYIRKSGGIYYYKYKTGGFRICLKKI